MDRDLFERIVAQASLAPSVHNTQPARWRRTETGIDILCDGEVVLPVGDPDGRDAGLSCGAAVEATVIALSAKGISVTVDDQWKGAGAGLRPVARLTLNGPCEPDPMVGQLEHRFTHRGVFAPGTVSLFGWGRADVALVTDPPRKAWLAELNDRVSLDIMRGKAFRTELLHWMRLLPWSPRYETDGLNREALRLTPVVALGARLALGPLWGLCNLFGLSRAITAEAEATTSAQAIACFHRPLDESPVETGRAYMRMCLEAAHLGMASWPMASLADNRTSRDEITARLGLSADRRLVQVIRFGTAETEPPPRARRSVGDLTV